MSQRPGSPSKSKGKFYHAWEMEKQQAAQVGQMTPPPEIMGMGNETESKHLFRPPPLLPG